MVHSEALNYSLHGANCAARSSSLPPHTPTPPQLQFHLTGPRGRATVNADMYMEDGEWKHNFLYLDVHEPQRQQVVLIRPEPVYQTAS